MIEVGSALNLGQVEKARLFTLAYDLIGQPYQSGQYDCFNFVSQALAELADSDPSYQFPYPQTPDFTLQNLVEGLKQDGSIQPCSSLAQFKRQEMGIFFVAKDFFLNQRMKYHTGFYFNYPDSTSIIHNRTSILVPKGIPNHQGRGVVEHWVSNQQLAGLITYWNYQLDPPTIQANVKYLLYV